MKAYPLIYSRTKNDDFVPDFLTRPADLDWKTALKYITSSIANLGMLNGIRYNIFSVNDYRCIGISCITKKLVSQLEETYAITPDKVNKASNYLNDCKGRNIGAFIGFAIPRSETLTGRIPDIELSEYWEVYQEYLEHQWENQHTESEKLSFPSVELHEKTYNSLQHKPEIVMLQQKYVVKNFHSDSSTEKATLDYFLDKIMNQREDISFISDIVYQSDWNNMFFTYAYVSDSLYKSISSSVEYENRKTANKTGMSTGISSGQTEIQRNKYDRMRAGYQKSQSTVPVSQEKPLGSDKKFESGGSKKNMGIFGKLRDIVADNNSNNTAYEVNQSKKDSTYYEQKIYNYLNQYPNFIEMRGNWYEIAMKKNLSFYNTMQNLIFAMLSAEQTGYRYIKNIVFAMDEQKIRILLK